VSQLKLFDSCEGALTDGECGCITYNPRFVDAQIAQAWFTEIRNEVTWRSQRREMYDREVDVPRLLGHFRLDPVPSTAPAAIRDAASRVAGHLGMPFNSVGLNLYRDGRDGMGWHCDDEPELGSAPVIASLSLGATRRFCFKHKRAGSKSIALELPHGSLLMMRGDTQKNFRHALTGFFENA